MAVSRLRGVLAAIVIALMTCVLSSPTAAQQPKRDVPKVDPKALPCDHVVNVRNKYNLTELPPTQYVPKKTAEGWPDFQGNWSGNDRIGGGHGIEVGFDPAGFVLECWDAKSNIGSIMVDPMKGQIPYNAEGQKKRDELLAALYAPTKRMDQEPTDLCFPRGVSTGGGRIRYIDGGIMLPSPKNARIIRMDDGPPLPSNVKLLMGESRGHWEGNTLVVVTTNNREGTWFDVHGTHHNDQMKATERWTMIDENTMYKETTIEDPKVFSRPWKTAVTLDRSRDEGPQLGSGARLAIERGGALPGGGVGSGNTATQEDACHEGERDIDHITFHGIRANVAGYKGYHIHVDLETGQAVAPFEQHYLDKSGQPLGHSFAPAVSDEEVKAALAEKRKKSAGTAKPPAQAPTKKSNQ